MKRYEVVAIVKSDLTEEEINAIMERSSNIITERQGVIAKAEKWGKRRLAYEIKKQKDGFYFFIDYAGEGSIVSEMERNFKIDDRVLKFMTVTKEGAVTREGMDAEVAAAEVKRSQIRIETENAGANKDEKAAAGEARPGRPAPRKTITREENTTKGE
ncbi:MAG: 30S ribosomal protein S6 [Deltaproteobacteria bacterium ADurb.Bin151]|nr:30S ribosomal protein S6 [Smithella sp.]OQB56886.1 MAG: 30S ribosomal protein S6 [Deltaproteobacteria bacterium ADurb.Bin151]HNZ10639.1 30S ribosomal protein S6 [Smithellaceae bacterium]HOG81318.1 30S ribosomal protein S6 [Smithellaceae bacterium]HOQ42904.1 30S ribosomal protein S6 [Smithellaceae bacterium]